VKTSNVELWNDIIRKNGDLKSLRETVKALEIASEGSQMMKSAEEEKSQDKGGVWKTRTANSEQSRTANSEQRTVANSEQRTVANSE